MTLNAPPPGTWSDSFGYLINRLARKTSGQMKANLEPTDISIKLFPCLMIIARAEGSNQRQLGKGLGFPEYSTSRAIDALVTAGFAERRADPKSRRNMLIYLTPEGRKKAASLPAIVQQTNGQMLEKLSLAEREQLMTLLKKAIAG
ncbi:MAG: MarR family transcriptional regulator [Rhodobacteraceae bacterium]|nr:MarR family transcriptional regulator [Paracoccaceae bacterium]